MVCSFSDCDKPVRSRRLCEKHYYRSYRYGDPAIRRKNANGDGNISPNGYRRITVGGVRKFEHVVVMEELIGRELRPGEVVHHLNEDKLDNRSENLVLLSGQGEHNIIHGRLKAGKRGGADKRPCKFCHVYDEVSSLTKSGTSHYHKRCNAEYHKALRERKRA